VPSVAPPGGYCTTAVLEFDYRTRRFLDGRPRARRLREAVLLPLWAAGQHVAPLLDKRRDGAPVREAHSCAVSARRNA